MRIFSFICILHLSSNTKKENYSNNVERRVASMDATLPPSELLSFRYSKSRTQQMSAKGEKGIFQISAKKIGYCHLAETQERYRKGHTQLGYHPLIRTTSF